MSFLFLFLFFLALHPMHIRVSTGKLTTPSLLCTNQPFSSLIFMMVLRRTQCLPCTAFNIHNSQWLGFYFTPAAKSGRQLARHWPQTPSLLNRPGKVNQPLNEKSLILSSAASSALPMQAITNMLTSSVLCRDG